MNNKIFDSDFAEIFYNNDNKMVLLSWKRPVNSEEYRTAFLKVLKTFTEHNFHLLLSDTRLQGAISPSDRKWLETEIIPIAIEAGLKYTATVISEDVFKKYYLGKLKEKSQKAGMTEFEIFDNYDRAIKWLLDKNT
ncbi:MAG: hypothetical protein JXR68_05615 [Bacteroidales bacterium]|nr:hypothetical protein [Bacteroidales bacterium]